MYTLALLFVLGLVAVEAADLITRIPVVRNIERFTGGEMNFLALVTLGVVALTDTSILGAWGIGNGNYWVDLVGSTFAVIAGIGVSDAVVNSFARYGRK